MTNSTALSQRLKPAHRLPAKILNAVVDHLDSRKDAVHWYEANLGGSPAARQQAQRMAKATKVWDRCLDRARQQVVRPPADRYQTTRAALSISATARLDLSRAKMQLPTIWPNQAMLAAAHIAFNQGFIAFNQSLGKAQANRSLLAETKGALSVEQTVRLQVDLLANAAMTATLGSTSIFTVWATYALNRRMSDYIRAKMPRLYRTSRLILVAYGSVGASALGAWLAYSMLLKGPKQLISSASQALARARAEAGVACQTTKENVWNIGHTLFAESFHARIDQFDALMQSKDLGLTTTSD